MVGEPDSLTIEVVDSVGLGLLVRVQAPVTEVGKLIGVNGRTARALRTILTAVAMTSAQRYSFDISGEGPHIRAGKDL